MAKLMKLAARMMGWSSIALGGVVLVRPKQLGKLLALDTEKQAGLAMTFALAIRDFLVGLYIVRAKDTKTLKRGVMLRLLCEMSDLMTFTFGKGFVLQPQGRKIILLTIPPIVAVEVFVRQSLKD